MYYIRGDLYIFSITFDLGENRYMKNKSYNNRKITVFLISLFSLFIMLLIYFYFFTNDIFNEKERCFSIAESEASHIVTKLDSIMSRTNTLKILIIDHEGETDFFDGVSEQIYRDVTYETGVSLKNFAIAPNCVVSNVYPYEGNESFVGFDFMDPTKEGNAEAREAYERGETILTNPFPLVQGGMGIAGRAPVIINNDGKDEFWGLVTVTIDLDNLIDVLNLDTLDSMGMDYQLSYIDADGSKHCIKSNVDEISQNAISNNFKVRNLMWRIEIIPKDGWFSISRTAIALSIIVIVSIFFGVFANLLFKLKDSNDMLLEVSNTDKMTGCLNRRAYEDDLAKLESSGLSDNFIYVSVDVNMLKRINDTLGHLAGDELIIGASECLTECFGKLGKLYRIGGDEFVVLLFAKEEEFEKALNNLKEVIANWKGETISNLSMSVGYAAKKDYPDSSMFEIAKTADKNMYEDKHNFYNSKGLTH